MPGNDDTRTHRADSYVRDRRNGDFYRETWRAAFSTYPDWIIITSWNEWVEGTMAALMVASSMFSGSDLNAAAAQGSPSEPGLFSTTLPNGLKLHKQRVPLGVLGVIYEARPNVTMDVAGLSIKTGNAAILRGGKETIHSNRALVKIIQQTLNACGLPALRLRIHLSQ